MEGSGIINLLKPAGMTSHDCVNHIRRLTGVKRIGHAGTLDPMATGVLVICIGKATRIIEYLEEDNKQYLGEMLLGITTDTQDIWGNILDSPENAKKIPQNTVEIQEIFRGFEGTIQQEVPGYSAVRINGKRLYEYSRSGERVERPRRAVRIYRFEVIGYNREEARVRFLVDCSKGTYVRTLCHDAGCRLETGAAMSFLLRTGSGFFRSSESVTLEELEKGYEKYLLPMDYPLGHLGRADLTKEQSSEFCNGRMLKASEVKICRRPQTGEYCSKADHRYCLYYNNEFLGVAVKENSKDLLKAEKVLCL